MAAGPLNGVRLVEIAGLGPTPFAAMMLADMGAEVIRVERPEAQPLIPQSPDFLNRSRQRVIADLKNAEQCGQICELINCADGVIEGMRPGVMERLNLGPAVFEQSNPRLVYGRMTGWGQDGPLSATAGHDITYISLTGALDAIGPPETPVPPLNLLGDFGGGALYLAFGMVAALFEASKSGQGQVVDAAIFDGATHLMTMIHSFRHSGLWSDARQSNILDGAAPFYGTYACSCGGFIAVGALEEKFYSTFLDRLGVAPSALPPQHDVARWSEARQAIAARFKTKSRDQWSEIFGASDACVVPVLSVEEAPNHPHAKARRVFDDSRKLPEPAPAPKFSRTPGKIQEFDEGNPADIQTLISNWKQ